VTSAPASANCRATATCTGARSAYAAQSLTGAGWTAVNVADGMTGWAVAGRPMVSETGAEPFVA
jgi:hypothetical protein